MPKLFSFTSLSILTEPSPDEILKGDARWALEVSRRRTALMANQDGSNIEWLLRMAEFSHETGRYLESEAYLKRVISAWASNGSSLLARALFFQCSNYLSISNGRMADRVASRLAKLASDSTDPYILAINNLVKGVNRQYNVGHMRQRQLLRGAEFGLPLFQDAIPDLLSCGDFDMAIRACLELARAHFEIGSFFTGIDTVERVTSLMREHGCWNLSSNVMVLAASNISDMGYRISVEDAIRRTIAWCDYLGDAWSRIEGLTVLGRFLHYTMAPGDPSLALEPDQYFQMAAQEAEELGASRLTASIDTARFFLFRKAGDDRKVQVLLGDATEEEEFRQKQVLENRREIERIAENRRQKTALRLHDGVEDTHDAFFVFDALFNSEGICRDFCWAYVNRAAARILEKANSQVFLFSEARLIPDLAGLEDALFGALNDRVAFEDMYEIGYDSGSVWLHRRVVPSGAGAVVTLRNVTAEKRIETALRQAAESARQSETTKTAFLASMSHEIRTPLNGVLGLARMLAESEMTPVQRAYVNDIISSGNTLLELIGDVLDLSKIEAREMQLSLSPVSLQSAIVSVVNLFQGQAQERGIVLRFTIDSGVPETVLVDAVRLRQILSNLIGNAVKFTDDGNVQVDLHMDDRFVVFEIRDTGIGMSEAQIGDVFNRFRQAGHSERGGTGLGLAITKALAELMGGNVSVRSEIGAGSTFTVRLPLSEAPAREVAKIAAPLKFEGRRVLIVDDNQVNLTVSSHVIRKFGCQTVCAKDGADALEILAREQFDLVFMDVRMPGLNGLEATREIRVREAGASQTPVIALTAGALLQEQEECFEAGMDDFVTKPITPDSIQTILTKWLLKE